MRSRFTILSVATCAVVLAACSTSVPATSDGPSPASPTGVAGAPSAGSGVSSPTIAATQAPSLTLPPEPSAAPAASSTPGADASGDTGCGPSVAPAFDDSFKAWDPAGEHPTYRPLRSHGTEADLNEAKAAMHFDVLTPARLPKGYKERLVIIDGETVLLLYGPNEVGQDETPLEFFEAGGVVVEERPPLGTTGPYVKDAVGDKAGLVQVGPWQAALTHGDEIDVDGVRTYTLGWEDSTRGWIVEANLPEPEALIDLARSLYCS